MIRYVLCYLICTKDYGGHGVKTESLILQCLHYKGIKAEIQVNLIQDMKLQEYKVNTKRIKLIYTKRIKLISNWDD